MYVKLEEKYGNELQTLEIPFKIYDNNVYLAIEDIKQNYDRLEETIKISSLIKFNSLVFLADFEVLKAVN